MKLLIKRFDKSLPLPVHKTTGAVAVDLCSRIDLDIQSKEIAYIPMNIALKIPNGYFVLLAPRSSTHKLGIQQINSLGIVDRDFCGDNDEFLFAVRNFTDKSVHINKGDRLCQLLLIKCEKFDFDEVGSLSDPSRGGFGTTGVN